jgi:hypothetical protein
MIFSFFVLSSSLSGHARFRRQPRRITHALAAWAVDKYTHGSGVRNGRIGGLLDVVYHYLFNLAEISLAPFPD